MRNPLLSCVALALCLAACTPEPVDPAFDEDAGQKLLVRYEAARTDGDWESAEYHAEELRRKHGETKAAATMRATITDVRERAEARREERRLAGLWTYQTFAVLPPQLVGDRFGALPVLVGARALVAHQQLRAGVLVERGIDRRRRTRRQQAQQQEEGRKRTGHRDGLDTGRPFSHRRVAVASTPAALTPRRRTAPRASPARWHRSRPRAAPRD